MTEPSSPGVAAKLPQQWVFSDFAVGQTFESQGRTITEADVVMFAAWSWDTNPVHTDARESATGRFGQRIAHGLLGLSVAMGLAARIGVFEGCSVALLDVRDWSFHQPLLIGDTVRCRVEIVEARPTSSGATGILGRQFELVRESGEVLQSGRIDLMVRTARG